MASRPPEVRRAAAPVPSKSNYKRWVPQVPCLWAPGRASISVSPCSGTPRHRSSCEVGFSPMPRGLVRFKHTGNFYFLTFSCYHQFQHLATVAARDLLKKRWNEHGCVPGLRSRATSSCPSMCIFLSASRREARSPAWFTRSNCRWRCVARSGPSGRRGSTTSLCTARKSASRRYAVCIETRSGADSSKNPKTGLVELPALRDRSRGKSRDRIAMDCVPA